MDALLLAEMAFSGQRFGVVRLPSRRGEHLEKNRFPVKK
jgi:hypothetical protein